MSKLYQTTGIVLSQRPFREADRFYSVLTKDRGKIEFIARGGSKPLAKLTPHLEMIAEVELLMVFGRTFQTVAGVERKKAFPELYRNLSKHTLSQNALYFVDIGTRTGEHDHTVYQLLSDWLHFVNNLPEVTTERAGFLLGSFVWKLMALTGYRPELHKCLSCRRTIEEKSYKWHGLRGGVVCLSCIQLDEQQWFAARGLSSDALKLVRFALQESFEDQLSPHLAGQALAAFHETTESFIISHFPTIPANSIRHSCRIV